MKKLILLAIIPLFLSCSGQTEQEKNKYTVDDWKKYSLEIQNTFNSKCPMMIDKETRLDYIVCLDNSVIYNFTMVNIIKEDLGIEDIKAFNKTQKTAMTNLVKTHPVMTYVRDYQLELTYIYSDKEKTFVTLITTTPSQYNN